jgi:hypothetical protein
MLWSSSFLSALQPLATSSLLGPDILLGTLNQLSSLSAGHQVSHPHKASGGIVVMYIVMFKFLHRVVIARSV